MWRSENRGREAFEFVRLPEHHVLSFLSVRPVSPMETLFHLLTSVFSVTSV